mgnify:CR=1 FL=1
MSTSMPTALAGGRYQLGQLVGRGGMAEVHIALDTRLGRTVAVKIMRADLAHDEIFLTRFRREAHSVAQMNNPNIVNIYDPKEIVISDIMSGGGEVMMYAIKEAAKERLLPEVYKDLIIRYSSVEDLILYGAATVAIDKILEKIDVFYLQKEE